MSKNVSATKTGPGRRPVPLLGHGQLVRESGTKLIRGAINKTLTVRTAFRNIHASEEQLAKGLDF